MMQARSRATPRVALKLSLTALVALLTLGPQFALAAQSQPSTAAQPCTTPAPQSGSSTQDTTPRPSDYGGRMGTN